MSKQELPPTISTAERIETVPLQINNNVAKHSHNGFKKFIAGVFLGAASVLGAQYEFNSPPTPPDNTTIAQPQAPKIVGIYPTGVNYLAVAESQIYTKVSIKPNTWIFGVMNKSYGQSAIFTNKNGTQGGIIDTLVGVKDKGITTIQKGKSLYINIPKKDVVFTSAIDSSNVVLNPQGTMSAAGNAWDTLVGGINKKSYLQHLLVSAYLRSLARKVAATQATSCAEQYFPRVATTLKAAYTQTIEEQYKNAIRAGAHVSPINKENIHINLTGTDPFTIDSPSIPKSLTSSITTQSKKIKSCQISQNVTKPKNVSAPNGNSIPSHP